MQGFEGGRNPAASLCEVRLFEYVDPEEGFRGYLAYAGGERPLAAGGFRVQEGLTAGAIESLARAMRLKERMLQLNVDGAKCGIDYDPAAPGKREAMRRFIRFLEPHLRARLSLGPDMGTSFGEIEEVARQEGITSVKSAVARAQGLREGEVLERLRLLDARLGPLTLGERRAGHCLAAAALAVLKRAAGPGGRPTCAVQGFGTLGRSAVLSLHEAGVAVTSLADEHATIRLDAGLDLPRLLASPLRAPVSNHRGEAAVDDRSAVLRAPVDVLVLAACENAMTNEDASVLPARAVVVGANDGLATQVEGLLHRRKVPVVPDFIGGAGGSASMDALFAPARRPEATMVLERSGEVVAGLARRVLAKSSGEGMAPREAALALADDAPVSPDSKPYALRALNDAAKPASASSPGRVAPEVTTVEGSCGHQRAHIVDSRFYGHSYSTDESRSIFCDVCRFQRWLDIEAALALSQAELGLVPRPQAERIAEAARVECLDLDRVRDEIRRTRHSLVGLLSALQEACPGDAGQFIHYGATTQDIQDTGQALEMRDVLCQAERDLVDIVRALAGTARSHAETLMVGRTHAQPALPMTFGLKVAGWLDELLRDVGRLEQMKARVLVAQLFGGVGTMAGFGDDGPALLERFARRLGLDVPAIGWHVSRDRVVEYVTTLAIVSATLARIGDEMRTLSRPELGEMELAWHPGKVGSSTMPHKRNPEECEQMVVLARLAAAQVEVTLGGMLVEHERDARGLRLEWVAVADVSHYTLAALGIGKGVLAGFEVHSDRMATNARAAADAVCTEALMLALARDIGKQSAHALVYELSQAATSEQGDLRAYLLNSSEVRRHLSVDQLERIFDPGSYLGTASRLTHEVVASAERWLASREQRS